MRMPLLLNRYGGRGDGDGVEIKHGHQKQGGGEYQEGGGEPRDGQRITWSKGKWFCGEGDKRMGTSYMKKRKTC
jgi:hypothetical protein